MPFSQDFKQAPNYSHLIVTSLVTITGSFLLYTTTYQSNKNEELKALYTVNGQLRIDQDQLRLELDSQRKRDQNNDLALLDMQDKVLRLQRAIDLQDTYMDSMPFAAWIKKVDPDNEKAWPVMYKINQAYTALFGVTAYEYEGLTDKEIYVDDPELAQSYYENDMATLKDCRTSIYKESGILFGEKKDIISHKWCVTMPDGSVGIAGAAYFPYCDSPTIPVEFAYDPAYYYYRTD